MNKNWSTFTKIQLIKICRQSRWRLYSHLNKQELIQFVKGRHAREEDAARCIQTWFRKYRDVLKQYTIINDIDFVTLEKIDSRIKFTIKNHATKQIFVFNPHHLMRYILDTGQFINPFNRDEIKNQDLLRLHDCYIRLNEKRLTYEIYQRRYYMDHDTNIIAVKHALSRSRHEERERERLELHLQGNCQNIVEHIVGIIIDIPSPDVEVITQVMNYIIHYHFAQFLENFHHLLRVSAVTAKRVLRESISQIVCVADNIDQSTFARQIANSVSTVFITYYNQIIENETMDESV